MTSEPNPRRRKLRKRVDPLQAEAVRLQYELRSSFFFTRIADFERLVTQVDLLQPSGLDWRRRRLLGISTKAWQAVRQLGAQPHRVFCHPEVISKQPPLIAYYRSVAILPQKGAQRLAFGVANLEVAKGRKLSQEKARQLAALLNRLISAALQTDPTLTLDRLRLGAAMNYGTQLNGSWRNEIDAQARSRVIALLVDNLSSQALVDSLVLKDGTLRSPPFRTVRAEDIKSLRFPNGFVLQFGSEPDIAVLPPSGPIAGAVEVKAALDEAGALERYGAALKSFSNVRTMNKAAITVYLASCMTRTVRRRMATEGLVSQDFNLTHVLAGEREERKFKDYLRWVAHM